MASEGERPTGFVRALVAIAASLSLIGGLVVGATAVRWYSLRNVGVDPTPFVRPTNGSETPNVTGSCSTEPCNYLLLGSDSRAGLSAAQQEQNGTNQDIGGTTRADTIMLVHTDPATKKATVLSFPRDLWVSIPGHGMNKINAAFEGGINGGGPQLTANTVTALTGIPIDHYLYVDLQGFQDVVNTLGGVDMCIPAYNVNTPGLVRAPTATGGETQVYVDENAHIVDLFTGLDILPGCQSLDGTKALAYVRARHLPCDLIPDFARIGRQQQFMRSVINQMLQPAQLARALGLVGPVLASLHRDRGFTPADLVYLVGQLRGLSTGAVEFRSVPGTTGWAKLNGLRVSIVNMDPAAKEIFKAIQEGRSITGIGTELDLTAPSEANTTVLVLDTGNPTGAAATEDILVEAGFDVSPGVAKGGPPEGVRHAMIVYKPGQENYAKVVSTYFPDLKMVQVDNLDAPVVVVVPLAMSRPVLVARGRAAVLRATPCPSPTA